ncbi:MAG TPA: DNA polymerase III subunit gamma/tau, partial [Candidatus Cloacimonadota bacterium]|nr:DNA polymerase III subunit gamma/tau [Candidatus Cloacimonadota bacterium]
TQILQNAITSGRVSHAFLFAGPRGVGKTSMARILAKSLNCIKGPTTIPCNVCDNCLEITAGTSPDVIEIDGASNTGVDDIRDLQKELMYSASKSHYKIYIIDEVHMLSKNAFNALLKTLEEPPDNVIFIFATTEPQKVIPTIVSRCQRFDFKRISIDSIVKRLHDLCKSENINIDEDALFLIARKADGGMRDALSLMDQVISYGTEHISIDLVRNIFGLLSDEVYDQMMEYINSHSANEMVALLQKTIEEGNDIQEFITGFLDYVRLLLLIKLGMIPLDVPSNQLEIRRKLAVNFNEETILYIISMLLKLNNDLRSSTNPLMVAEITMVKMTRITQIEDLSVALNKVEALSRTPQTHSAQTVRPVPNYQRPIKQDTEKIIQEQIIREVQSEIPKIEELTIDILNQHWNHIMSVISKEYPLIGTNLKNNSKLVSVTKNVIYLTTTSDSLMSRFKENRLNLENIISKQFNLHIEIDLKLESVDETHEKKLTNPTMQDIQKINPDLAKFIEITDSYIDNDHGSHK